MKRTYRKEEEWRHLIDDQMRSGVALIDWCKERKLDPTLMSKKRRLLGYEKMTTKGKKLRGDFIKFVPESQEMNGHIRVELKGGNAIVLSKDNTEGLRTVLSVLREVNA